MILNLYEFKSVHIKLQVTTLCEQGHKCIPYKSNGWYLCAVFITARHLSEHNSL